MSSSLMVRSITTLFRLPPCSSSSWFWFLSKQKRQFSSSNHSPSLFNPLHNFFPLRSSTEEIAISSDDVKKLNQPSKIIQKEIERVQDWVDTAKAKDCTSPHRFPFEIIDGEPGKRRIMLKRVISGETIDAVVGLDETDYMVNVCNKKVYLVVTVRKGEGPRLEICCVYRYDHVEVTSVKIKRPEESSSTVQNVIDHYELIDWNENHWLSIPRDFSDDIKNALCEYLETIGIEFSWKYFLLHYIWNKDMREDLMWFKSLRKTILRDDK